MNRNASDWPAVRAAVIAQMKEQGLSAAELARRSRTSRSTIQAFLNGKTRPCGFTLSSLSKGLGLPADSLRAIAERREPRPLPALTPGPAVSGAAGSAAADEATPVAALLSLFDITAGARLQLDYGDCVVATARELRQGMTSAQRRASSRFLTDVANYMLTGDP